MPADVIFGVNRNVDSLDHSPYVNSLKKHLQESYNIVTKAAAGEQQRQKACYDLKA